MRRRAATGKYALVPEHSGSEAGRLALAILRGLMRGFPADAEALDAWDPDEIRATSALLDAADRQVTYQLAALCAGLIRALAAETGRSEEEILDEIAARY